MNIKWTYAGFGLIIPKEEGIYLYLYSTAHAGYSYPRIVWIKKGKKALFARFEDKSHTFNLKSLFFMSKWVKIERCNNEDECYKNMPIHIGGEWS